MFGCDVMCDAMCGAKSVEWRKRRAETQKLFTAAVNSFQFSRRLLKNN